MFESLFYLLGWVLFACASITLGCINSFLAWRWAKRLTPRQTFGHAHTLTCCVVGIAALILHDARGTTVIPLFDLAVLIAIAYGIAMLPVPLVIKLARRK